MTARQLLHPALQPVREVCNQCIVRDVLHREARPIPNGMVVAQLGSAELEHARKRLAAVGLVGLVRWGASAEGLGQPALPRLEAGLGQVARAIEMVRAVGLQCEGVWPRREGEVVPAHRASVATRIHCHQPVIGAEVVECPWLAQKLGKGQALVRWGVKRPRMQRRQPVVRVARDHENKGHDAPDCGWQVAGNLHEVLEAAKAVLDLDLQLHLQQPPQPVGATAALAEQVNQPVPAGELARDECRTITPVDRVRRPGLTWRSDAHGWLPT